MVADRTLSILHVFPSFAIGGQQRRLATLVRGLGPAFSHRLFSLDGDVSATALLESGGAGVELFPLRKSAFVDIGNVRRLRRAIADSKADLLCTYNFGSIEAVIANRLGPSLPHVHHEDGFGSDEADGRQKFRRVLARRLLLRPSFVTVPSTMLERIALTEWRLDPGRVRRLPVGVDLERFSPSRRTAGGPVVVGSVGSLRSEKNYARLIRCFEKASKGHDARLVIVGDGPERRPLEALVAGAAARGRISLPGATARPEEALSKFDVFALSSDTEQMPTSLIEAMAAGLPAIATDVGDIRVIVGPDGDDCIVRKDDEALFTAKLRALVEDADLRARLGAANAVRSRTFSEGAMIEAFRNLYLEAAGAA